MDGYNQVSKGRWRDRVGGGEEREEGGERKREERRSASSEMVPRRVTSRSRFSRINLTRANPENEIKRDR